MIMLLSSLFLVHLMNAIPINPKVQMDFTLFNDDSRLDLLRAKSFVKPDHTKYEAAMKKLAKLYRESQEKAKKCLRRTNKSWISVVVDCTTSRPEVTTSSGYAPSTQNPLTNSSLLHTTTSENNEKLTSTGENSDAFVNQESHLLRNKLPHIGDTQLRREGKKEEEEEKLA